MKYYVEWHQNRIDKVKNQITATLYLKGDDKEEISTDVIPVDKPEEIIPSIIKKWGDEYGITEKDIFEISLTPIDKQVKIK